MKEIKASWNLYRQSDGFEFSLESICTSEFFKKLKLHEPLRRVQFQVFEKLQVQINSKLNEKNRMITF